MLKIFCVGVTAIALLTGCASVPPVPPPETIFRDALFAPGSQSIDARDLFALTPAMQDYLDRQVRPQLRSRGQRQGLIDALYSRDHLKLEYDASMTRNAAEAFEARSGNCLSLMIMTAAFAKQLDMPVRFQSVFIDEAWSRSGDLVFLSGHVNLSLETSLRDSHGGLSNNDSLMVDFIPAEMLRGVRTRVIDEATVVAMFMNNRAAENLHAGQVSEAYWWVREALRQDPKFTTAYNTLGVIYRRHGQLAAAEAALRHVLAREPDNAQALSNLVLVLREQDRWPESNLLAARLLALQPTPPFKYFDEGIAAMKKGEFKTAKRLFDKEIARSAYFHEFYFWLALAHYGLGEPLEARRAMAQAVENSTTRRDRDIYAAKLDWLKTQRPARQ